MAKPYTVRLSATETVEVGDLSAASRAVRAFIEEHQLGAGCSPGRPAFQGGEVTMTSGRRAGQFVARVSYNGRVWDEHGREIPLPPKELT